MYWFIGNNFNKITKSFKLSLFLFINRRLLSSSASSSCDSVKKLKINSNDFQKTTKFIRNIGFVAHIDAGKTTTAERILYYSGFSEHLGEVHRGDTIMDFLEQERERGITITMAAATIKWKNFDINLLDTPGHVDFTFEVERSLSVLDGAVVILDASAGVQAQTIKVWQQMRKYQIPAVIYLNKMDKSNASVELSIASVQRKLKIKPILLQNPCYHTNGTFIGLLDLVYGRYIEWPINYEDRMDHSDQYRQQFLLNSSENEKNQENFLAKDQQLKLQEQLYQEREILINQLCDFDDNLADHVLSLEQIEQVNAEQLIKSIRKQSIERRIYPILLGSSYRNIGIQPLLDSICNYLPEPMEKESNQVLLQHYTERNPSKPPESIENLCALAFKIHFHQRLGLITYLRIYSGSIMTNMSVYNMNRKCMEKIQRIYRPFADRFMELNNTTGITAGQIVAVVGLSSTITGDTLVHSSFESHVSDEQSDDDGNTKTIPKLAGIEIPEPVYYCSLECPSISKMKQLKLALDHLQREDPSLRVISDQNNQQLIIKGMGELHIEIIKERIKREYGVEVETGPLQVSYKETITNSKSFTMEQSKTIASQSNYVKINLQVIPKLIDQGSDIQDFNNINETDITSSKTTTTTPIEQLIKIVNTKTNNLSSQIKPWQLKAIQNGIRKALEYGPLFSFPVVGIQILIHDFQSTNKTSPAFISNIIGQCLLEAIRSANPILLEPIMRLEIITPEQYVGVILSDLSGRRSQLISADDDDADNTNGDSNDYQERHILALVPLAEMFNYSTVLRTISSGMASLEMNLHSYKPIDEQTTAEIIKKISGIQ